MDDTFLTRLYKPRSISVSLVPEANLGIVVSGLSINAADSLPLSSGYTVVCSAIIHVYSNN